MSKKMEKKLMIKFKYVFWIKYPWWTSKSKVNPLCFKIQSWCLKPRLIYAILLFSWPNSSLITRNWNFGVLRQKISDIKHLPAVCRTERDFRFVYLNFQSSINNLRSPLLWAVGPYGNLRVPAGQRKQDELRRRREDVGGWVGLSLTWTRDGGRYSHYIHRNFYYFKPLAVKTDWEQSISVYKYDIFIPKIVFREIVSFPNI